MTIQKNMFKFRSRIPKRDTNAFHFASARYPLRVKKKSPVFFFLLSVKKKNKNIE